MNNSTIKAFVAKSFYFMFSGRKDLMQITQVKQSRTPVPLKINISANSKPYSNNKLKHYCPFKDKYRSEFKAIFKP
jgi:hypothetical protein